MNWFTWVAILVLWPLVGLAVAYLFGRFTHRGEVYGNAGQLAPPVLSYLRRARHARIPTRAAAQTKGRREGSGGRSVH